MKHIRRTRNQTCNFDVWDHEVRESHLIFFQRRSLSYPVISSVAQFYKARHANYTRVISFAFRFLVDVFKKIEHKKTPYLSSLRARIRRVCKGHVTWLRHVRGLLDSDGTEGTKDPKERCNNLLPSGCFAANYWPTGKLMPRVSNSWQPKDSFTDTAFQILKIVDYFRFVERKNIGSLSEICDLLDDIRIPWLYELDAQDHRQVYAWLHDQDDGINTFRLDDHYWIWRALESVESLDLDFPGPCQPKKSSTGETLEREEIELGLAGDRWLRLLEGIDQDAWDASTLLDSAHERFSVAIRRLRSIKVQKGILQRFTTENDSARQRMLAFTRSPRETRFLLHARDTALLYEQGKSLFPDAAFQELWSKTLDSQVLYEENEDASWQNTLRYALSILVALNKSTLNKRTSMGLLRNSTEVLIGVSTHSGFIYGELEAESHLRLLPTQEVDRDYFYHASFEIPYILLAYGWEINQAFLKTAHGTLEDTSNVPGPSQWPPPQLEGQKPAIAVPVNPTDQLSSELQKLIKYAVDKTQDVPMKKAVPFIGLMDARNITNIPEEWLYTYPDFLLTKDIELPMGLGKKSGKSDARLSLSENLGSVISKGSTARSYRVLDNPGRDVNFEFSTETVTFVANAPRQKLRIKKERRRRDTPASAKSWNNGGLWSIISKKRRAETAKKRFIWLPHPDAQTAFLCWSASTESEKPRMSLFFDRHLRYEQHFWDSTAMLFNSWQTELHLSFYTLVRKGTPKHIGIPEHVRIPFPSDSLELRRASMGFRFDGDLFDRHWTCHFVQFVPCLEAPPDSVPRLPIDPKVIPAHNWDFEFDEDALGRFMEKHWWQRKVLELHLLTRILDLVIDNSARIRDEVKGELGIKSGTASFTTLNCEPYASSKDNWKTFERILQGVDEDLTSTLKTLEKWSTREKDRAPVHPRWTRDDERKYRGHINKFRGASERQVWHLEVRRDEVRKLLMTLDTSMEKIQTELEHKREENIRYFTYVTVIFLPLGFAASFYSMVCDHPSMRRLSRIQVLRGA